MRNKLLFFLLVIATCVPGVTWATTFNMTKLPGQGGYHTVLYETVTASDFLVAPAAGFMRVSFTKGSTFEAVIYGCEVPNPTTPSSDGRCTALTTLSATTNSVELETGRPWVVIDVTTAETAGSVSYITIRGNPLFSGTGAGGGAADDMGDHTATEDLKMGTWDITLDAGSTVDGYDISDLPLVVSPAAFTGASITTAISAAVTADPDEGAILALPAGTYTDVAIQILPPIFKVHCLGEVGDCILEHATDVTNSEKTILVNPEDVFPRGLEISGLELDGNKDQWTSGGTTYTSGTDAHRGIEVNDTSSNLITNLVIENNYIHHYAAEGIFVEQASGGRISNNRLEFLGCFDDGGSGWTPNGQSATDTECGTWGAAAGDEASETGRKTVGVGIEISNYSEDLLVDSNEVYYATKIGIQAISGNSTEAIWPNRIEFRNNVVGWAHDSGIAMVRSQSPRVINNYIHDIDTGWSSNNINMGLTCSRGGRHGVFTGNVIERTGGTGMNAACGCGVHTSTEGTCDTVFAFNTISQACNDQVGRYNIAQENSGYVATSTGRMALIGNVVSDSACTSSTIYYPDPLYNDRLIVTPANVADDIAWTGAHDFGGATALEVPNGAAPTVNATGEFAFDTTITDWQGGLTYYDGSAERTVISIPAADLATPTDNYILKYDAATDDWEFEADSGSSAFSAITTGTNTTANMTVGSGANFLPSGTGVILATSLDAVGAGAVTIGSADVTGITATSAGLITLDAGTNGTDVVIVGDDWDVTAAGVATFTGAVTASSYATAASATPTITLTDSDASGDGSIIVSDSAGPETEMQFWVDQATGTATEYLTLDGVTETISIMKPLYILEQADASADVAGYGQIWVNTASPNELWFTDDAGTDTQLGVAGSGEANTLASPDVASEVDLINSVSKTGTALNLVSLEADDFTVTSNIITIDTGATAGIQAHDAELDTIAALTETNGGVIFAAGGAWTTDTTPALDISDATGSLSLSGDIQGLVAHTITTGTTHSPAETALRGDWHFYSNTGVVTVTLPAISGDGNSACFHDVDGTAVLRIDPNASDNIILTTAAITDGEYIESAGAAGDFICLLEYDASSWIALGRSGTWVEETP